MTVYLTEDQVRAHLDPDALLAAVRHALIALSRGEAVQPLRTVMPLHDPAQLHGAAAANDTPGMLFLKPAQVGSALATKLITLVPANSARGLPALLATVVLMDPATGQTLVVMEGAHLTAMRTAAATAVAVDALCPASAGVVALLGSGVLARSHAAMLRRVRAVREIRVWSRDPANVRRCAEEIGGIACASAEQAVRGADIVCTLTHAREPVLHGAWLRRGAFVAAVGAPRPDWRELDDDTMRHWIVADQRTAAEQESGDVILSGARVAAELGEVLDDRVPPPPAGTTIVFKSLGLAVEDAVAAELVWQSVRARGAPA
jgi:thiomorpholine-carboxylate dehydrogenase